MTRKVGAELGQVFQFPVALQILTDQEHDVGRKRKRSFASLLKPGKFLLHSVHGGFRNADRGLFRFHVDSFLVNNFERTPVPSSKVVRKLPRGGNMLTTLTRFRAQKGGEANISKAIKPEPHPCK